MSRMNAIRITNLSYNNNAIHVEDELFELGTESTLFSLRNGGGKSVLVQMMMAPFIRKRYRDTKDRPFASYFTSNKPTYILVEWKLEQNAGYLLTGMMVRKMPENRDDDNINSLETIQFIYEYKERNAYDIYQFPLIKNEDSKKSLLLFGQAKLLFEDIKKNPNCIFNYYDMNQPNQFRSYFDKLLEYGINHKEWESIMKRVNAKESGLSELFLEAKDESGLIEKWFLPAIEDKLSKEESRIDKFVELFQKYMLQYQENRENYSKKETIEAFKEETKQLIELAKTCIEYEDMSKECENQLANLIQSLKQMISMKELESKDFSYQMENTQREIRHLESMQICYDIYLKKDEVAKQKQRLNQTMEESNRLEEKKADISKKLNLYECAKAYQQYEEANQEVIALKSSLEMIHRKDEDLSTERNDLGFSLKQHYANQLKEKEIQVKACEDEQKKYSDFVKNQTAAIETYNQTIQKKSEENGRLKSKLQHFDYLEHEFNTRFHMGLTRNIVGTYETVHLEQMKQIIDTAYETTMLSRKDLMQRMEEERLSLEEKNQKFIQLQTNISDTKSKQNQFEVTLKEFNEELNLRRAVLPYVNISEEDVFETQRIVLAFEKKIENRKANESDCMITLRKIVEEYHQLKAGKVLQLPKNFERKLLELEVSFVYGTQWLRNNGWSKEENAYLIEKNPFLPYSIILKAQELERLKNSDLQLYTSIPIPIIVREELEQEHDKVEQDETSLNAFDRHFLAFDHVNFYMAYNHNLLEKEGQEHLLLENESRQKDCNDRLAILQEEMKHFTDKMNLIKYQKVSKEVYAQTNKEKERLSKALERHQNELSKLSEEMEHLRAQMFEHTKENEAFAHQLDLSKEQSTAFDNLLSAYDGYLKDKEAAEKLLEDIQSLNQMIEEQKTSIKENESKSEELQIYYQKITMEHRKIQEKLEQFEMFSAGNILDISLEELEARYVSITKGIDQEESVLEEQLCKAKAKSDKLEAEYQGLAKEYHVLPEEFKALVYDVKMIRIAKNEVKEITSQEAKINQEKMQISNLITKLDTIIYSRIEDYYKKSGKRELLAKDQLVILDYKNEINKQFTNLKKIENELETTKNALMNCQSALAGLSEYEELNVVSIVECPKDMISIKQFKNQVINEYRMSIAQMNQVKSKMMQEVARLLRLPNFAEDYYRKPLEILETLTDTPQALLEQLTTTITAYDYLFDKIMVDLSLIEEEGARIFEVLLQYIKEVHENLSKIDRNSTITIHDQNIKMLKIKLPEWEEEKKTYENRCKQYVDELVTRCAQLLNQNKNVEELIASYITTKNLFNQVVGLNNIQIHLYKIEEEREYPITWSQVSKNSGGEGFLSAFVILSSLLSYMRKDDADIFNDRENGKVLIMDNPFAQTNASHLLIPLMDIAKKSNTQLICLSGLGGESIYNRFDNIYVLNLVSSKLKESTQYLYGEHMKGEDLVSIVANRIKVEEEQLVLF